MSNSKVSLLLPRKQKLSTEQLEAKAVDEMIRKAHSALLENHHTVNWIVFNCHDVKTIKQVYKMSIRALE